MSQSTITSKEWLEGREATELLSQINGRQIQEGVVRDWAAKGKIRKQRKPGYSRLTVYSRYDIEGLHPIKQYRRSTAKKSKEDARTP